jgi:hypothetical protein
MSRPCPLLGLIISVTRHAPPAERETDPLADDLLSVLEHNGLVARAGATAREYIVSREGGQVTDVDRQLILAWAERWARLATIGVSQVTDLDDDA